MHQIKTFTLALASLVAAQATAQEFVANHIFIASPDTSRVIELDENAQFVRDITDPAMAIPHALAFGPNGRLYVGSANGRVFEFTGDGNSTRDFSVGTGPEGLQFSTNGSIMRAASGTIQFTNIYVDPPSFAGLIFVGETLGGLGYGADGRIYVASAERGAVLRFEPDSFAAGAVDIAIDDDLEHPEDVVLGENGRMWVSDVIGDQLHEFTGNGIHLDSITIPGFADPDGLTFGPDDHLWVTSNLTTHIARVNPDNKTFQTFDLEPFGALHPADIAFAPTRFIAKVKGKVIDDDGVKTKIKETVVVSWAPGSRCLMMELSALGADSLQEIFFDRAWVHYGYEMGPAFSNKKQLSMKMRNSGAQNNGTAEANLKAVGSVSLSGMFQPAKLTGGIHRTDSGQSFVGSLKTKTRIN